jgi:tetrahydromethanopterin S-methyltransferase subunit G
MSQRMNEIKSIEEELKTLNIKDITRDIEILKQKVQWIENNIEKINIKPLHERIQEIEHKINTVKISSPYVIE